MIQIDGIEVTQSIQYFQTAKHLTNAAEWQLDNSIAMTAGKAAWVRVYVSSTGPESVAGVSAVLNVDYRQQLYYSSFPPFQATAQAPTTITADVAPNYAARRSSQFQTLNFLIESESMIGLMTLQAVVTAPGLGTPVTASLQLLVTQTQTLKLRGVMVGYNGPNPVNSNANLTIAAPTVSDLQSTAAWTMLTYPVRSTAVFEVATTITQNVPLSGTATNGGCTQSWNNLVAAIAAAAVADGNRKGYIYYGLIPSNFPNTSNVGGCDSGGTAAGPVGGQVALAHEVGHACGRAHAPCGSVGSSADPNYPAYPPYDSTANRVASIGEYGLNISTGDIMPPNIYRDFMSYCAPTWISLYGLAVFTNNSALNPETIGIIAPWWKRYEIYNPWWWLNYLPDPPPWFEGPIEEYTFPMQQVIAIIGVLDELQTPNVSLVARCEVYSTNVEGVRTDLVAELQDVNGRVLASAPVIRSVSRGCGRGSGCGCGGTAGAPDDGLGSFTVYLPNPERGATLVIRKGEQRLWQRSGGAPRVQVRLPAPQVAKSGKGTVRVSWKSANVERSATEKTLTTHWLRCSADQGRTWKSISTGAAVGPVDLDAAHLPPGKLLIELLEHDGFDSYRSAPAKFDNVDFVPEPAILNPIADLPMFEGEALHLWGSIAVPDRAKWKGKIRWKLDREPVGNKLEVWLKVPAPGKHTVEMTVTSESNGQSKSVKVEFQTLPSRLESSHRNKL